MQNQTPEIQAKLLAMQRMMVTKPTTPTTTTITPSQPLDDDMDEDSLSSLDSSTDDFKPVSTRMPKVDNLQSKEQREDNSRFDFTALANSYYIEVN